MKRQLIALSMVIVMVASVCTVAATTVSAHTATNFSIEVSTPNPNVGAQFTITGTLTTSTGTPLTYKSVHLESHKKNSDGTWTTWQDLADTTSMKTGPDGKVSSTRTLTSAGVREYRWHFPQTTTYAGAYSAARQVWARFETKVTVSAQYYQTNVAASNTINVVAQKWDAAQSKFVPLAGKTLKVWHITLWPDGVSKSFDDPSVTTGADGKVSFTAKMGTEPSKREFYVLYPGGNTLQAVAGKTDMITSKWKTSVSLNIQKPSAGSRTIYGWLSDQNGNGVNGALLKIFRYNGATNTWDQVALAETYGGNYIGNGFYTKTIPATSDSTYFVRFGGSQTLYWPSDSPRKAG